MVPVLVDDLRLVLLLVELCEGLQELRIIRELFQAVRSVNGNVDIGGEVRAQRLDVPRLGVEATPRRVAPFLGLVDEKKG